MKFDSLEEAHSHLLSILLHSPDFESFPRGKPIREVIAHTFTLTDPRNRLIMSPTRSVNYGFAVGELCWYLRGDSDLETMLYYNKRMSQFSDDGKLINSAYGARIFNGGGKTDVRPSQWSLCIEELRADPHSRRAVMHINQPYDLRRAVSLGSKDVPCTMSMQMFIRNRRLHMHVLMRSNDIIWGLPYDVFSFTCLMEAFLYELQAANVPVDGLGEYIHTAGSLHLYDQHYEMARGISLETNPRPAPMQPFTLDGLEWLCSEFEPACRKSVLMPGVPALEKSWLESTDRDPEPTTIEWMTAVLVDHRDKRVIENIKAAANLKTVIEGAEK